MAGPAILDFFDPEAIWPVLHYGDSVCLLPNGENALVSYAGAPDGRPWVLELEAGAAVPPNLEDCHFRLMVRGNHNEQKELLRLQHGGLWDQGRNLHLPDHQRSGVDLSDLAEEFALKHGLEDVPLVKAVMDQVKLAHEEIQGNKTENQRLQGLEIHYLETVEFRHVGTGKTLNLVKQQAYERSSKKVELQATGSDTSVFVLRPAFKARSAGEVVSSGDLVVLQSLKRVGGQHYCLHLGTHHGRAHDEILRGSMQIKSPEVVKVHELNGNTGDPRPTAWRIVLFEPYQHSPLNAVRFKQYAERFRCEQVVCFYHKEAEAYLDYRTSLGDRPVFRTSNRVAVTTRKKASWMWTVENLTVFSAGAHVLCTDKSCYRIKHVVTHRYLALEGSDLKMTNDYLDPGTLFNFRPFAKDSREEWVKYLGLVYVRTSDGFPLHQIPIEDIGNKTKKASKKKAPETSKGLFKGSVRDSEKGKATSQETDPTPRARVLRRWGSGGELIERTPSGGDIRTNCPGMDLHKETFVGLNRQDVTEESDALLVMPVAPHSVASVLQIRRHMIVLRDFTELLETIGKSEELGTLKEEAEEEEDEDFLDGYCPDVLPEETDTLLHYVDQWHHTLIDTLSVLIRNSSFDEDKNPLSRDGPPNRLMQKLLRELDAISVVMNLVQLPFATGVKMDWMGQDDPRFDKLQEIIQYCYHLMKQVVKEHEGNALELHTFVDVIRSHQGMGLGETVCLKEIYLGKRTLLATVQPDVIQQFATLLRTNKDPRLIDFLVSLCSCGDEQMPNIQKMICDELLNNSEFLLPAIDIQRSPGQATKLLIRIAGLSGSSEHNHSWKDVVNSMVNNHFWIDVSKFNDTTKVHGRDMASHILTASVSELDADQKIFRYFTRCCNLCGKVSQGRNQTALAFLLQNTYLSLTYDDILAVLKEPSLPSLTRARFTMLMVRLYVDRDPQTSKPQIMYTRTWSKIVANTTVDESTLSGGSMREVKIPVCKTGFVDLCEHLLQALGDLGGARSGRGGQPSLNGLPTYGQLELIAAQVAACDLLVDFGFFTKGRDAREHEEDFQQVHQLFSAAFAIVDTRGYATAPSQRREAMMLVDLRSQALSFLIRILNLRANFRITVMLSAWERLFETMKKRRLMTVSGDHPERTVILSMKSGGTEKEAEKSQKKDKKVDTEDQADFMDKSVISQELLEQFGQYDEVFEKCVQSCFQSTIISAPESQLRADSYHAGDFENGEPLVEAMLNLMGFKDPELTSQACALLMRHMAQRTRVTEDMKMVQILAYPSAVKVYFETEKAIETITSLRKHIFKDEESAYEEAESVLVRVTGYITKTGANHSGIVRENQRIMLNHELDEPVCDLLRLDMERDTSPRAYKDADKPMNPRRRDLFQQCYDFLRALCMGNREAQAKLFPLLHVFSEHVGIESLNVSDTLSEMVRDNSKIVMQVPESFFRQFLDAMHMWGRKARWLRIFEVFLEAKGKPLKRNQDLLMRLLMEDVSELVDLECDFSRGSSKYLPDSDPRQGKTMQELIIDGDHRLKVRSLVKFHYSSINTLALCAAGRNSLSQSRIMSFVSLDLIVRRFLSGPLNLDGVKIADPEFDMDGVYYVRTAWTRLITNVFLTSLDTTSIKQLVDAKQFWTPRSATGRGGRMSPVRSTSSNASRRHFTGLNPDLKLTSGETSSPKGLKGSMSQGSLSRRVSSSGRIFPGMCLMGEYVVDVLALAQRLKDLQEVPGEGFLDGVKDATGWDIGQHVAYIAEVMRMMLKLFARTDVYDPTNHREQKPIAVEVREALAMLFYQLKRCKRGREAGLLLEVVVVMQDRGVKGVEIATGVAEPEAPKINRSDQAWFTEGWGEFQQHMASFHLKVDPAPGKTMLTSIQDMAMMLGSRNTYRNRNYEVLGEFIAQLSSKSCDPLVQLNGLKVVRAILYLQPDRARWTTAIRNREFHRMMRNETPSDAEKTTPQFTSTQTLIGSMGGVELVVAYFAAPEKQTVLAALMLAVAMLDGGCRAVQDMFAAILTPALSSQTFFQQLHQIIEDGITALKQQKHLKQEVPAESMTQLLAASNAAPALSESLQYMTEVMKMLARFCMGQHKPLQDILLNQRFNKVSYDFYEKSVNYLSELEPQLREAIRNEDLVVVEGGIRGFHMLADAMRGPNHANQFAISSNALYDLIHRFMVKLQVESPEGSKKGAFCAGGYDELARNNLRSRLKTAVTTCVLQFLEGGVNPEIPRHMLNMLQWSSLASNMDKCFKLIQSGSKLVDQELLYEEGLNYFFTLKFLKNFDENDQFIVPAWTPFMQAVHFFETRCGYVEIMRSQRVERVYFALPVTCIPGGALDKDFPEMFDAERSDPDRKNQNFLDNMLAVIQRTMHQEVVRDSNMAWTIQYFTMICSVSFYNALLIHMTVIFGSYTPWWHREAAMEYMGASDPTPADVWFNEDMMPTTIGVSIALTIILGLVACLRAVAFVYAELWDIIRDGLHDSKYDKTAAEGAWDQGEVDKDDRGELDLEESEEEKNNRKDPFAEKTNLSRKPWKESASGSIKVTPVETKPSNWKRVLIIVLKSPWCWYEFLLFTTVWLAVLLQEPTIGFWPLFEFCFWKESNTVIAAIRFNLGKMVQTFILGILMMYLWLLTGIWFLYDSHQMGKCINMFQCFTAYFFHSMLGDGVRQVMETKVEIHQNISDLAISGMLFRVIWDVAFVYIFLYLLLAIITGIVIEAFWGLREEIEVAEADLQARCFVCNLDRFTLDQKTLLGFDKHVRLEHNPRLYLFFLLRVKMTPKSKLTGQEAYVREMVWPSNPDKSRSYHWLPREQTLSLRVEEVAEDTTAKIMREMHNDMMGKVQQTLATHEAKMSETLAELSDPNRGQNTPRDAAGWQGASRGAQAMRSVRRFSTSAAFLRSTADKMAIRTPRAVVEAQRPKSKSEADIYGGLLEDMRGKVGADSNIRKGEGDTPTPTDTPPSLTPVKVDDKVDPDRDTQVRQGHGQDSPLTPAGQGPIAAMRAQARQAQGRQTRHGEGSPLASAVGAGWQEASEERQEPGEVSQESSAAWEQHSAASHEASETMEQPSKASQESSEAMQPPSEARDDADTPSSQKTPSVPSLNLSRRVSNSNLGGRQSPSSKASLTAKPPSPRAASSVKSTRPARAGSAK